MRVVRLTTLTLVISAFSSYSLRAPRNLLLSTSRTPYKKHIMSQPLAASSSAATAVTATASIAILDKEAFKKDIRLVALKIPAKSCSAYMTKFAADSYVRPKTKKVYEAPGEPMYRLLLLAEKYQDLGLADLPKELSEFNEQHGGTAQEFVLSLNYDNLGFDEVLRRILPAEIKEIPSAFEQAGHLAHLNLRDEALPYKHLIAQVLLDKNPSIKTVVNKIGNIETEFRTFPMELLAGDDDYEVTLKESHAKFTFNFAQVYWNSRLQMEHARLIGIIQKHAGYITIENPKHKGKASASPKITGSKLPPLVVADMMAGVGPFAVPLAMPVANNNISTTTWEREIIVHANDLNPASFKYLEVNGRNNNCPSRRLHNYNMCGRQFILKLIEENIPFHHAIMNLPQNATDFLDVFVGMHTRVGADRMAGWGEMPRIHVYAFSTYEDDPIGDIARRSATVLRCSANCLYPGLADGGKYERPLPRCEGYIVRDVAPKKVMVCLSFTLPKEVADAAPLDFNSKKRPAGEAGLQS